MSVTWCGKIESRFFSSETHIFDIRIDATVCNHVECMHHLRWKFVYIFVYQTYIAYYNICKCAHGIHLPAPPMHCSELDWTWLELSSIDTKKPKDHSKRTKRNKTRKTFKNKKRIQQQQQQTSEKRASWSCMKRNHIRKPDQKIFYCWRVSMPMLND